MSPKGCNHRLLAGELSCFMRQSSATPVAIAGSASGPQLRSYYAPRYVPLRSCRSSCLPKHFRMPAAKPCTSVMCLPSDRQLAVVASSGVCSAHASDLLLRQCNSATPRA